MAQFLYGFGTNRQPAGRWALALLVALALVLPSAPLRAAPIDDGYTRLAEILGAAHHLRDLCGANEGSLWRNKMIDLLNAASPDPVQRQVLISHFNDAYYRAQTGYRRCTPAAAAEINALFDEGRALAARLAGADRSAAAF